LRFNCDMPIHLSLSDAVGFCGLVFGLVGFVLGVLNFWRDNPRLIVTLQWDLTVTPNTKYDARKRWGIVKVVNVGRRPIYISHAALQIPKGYDHNLVVLMEGLSGKKLSEGDPPENIMVSQDGMEMYAKKWRGIRAQVSDSAGKVWSSKYLKRNQIPSWAKASGSLRELFSKNQPAERSNS